MLQWSALCTPAFSPAAVYQCGSRAASSALKEEEGYFRSPSPCAWLGLTRASRCLDPCVHAPREYKSGLFCVFSLTKRVSHLSTGVNAGGLPISLSVTGHTRAHPSSRKSLWRRKRRKGLSACELALQSHVSFRRARCVLHCTAANPQLPAQGARAAVRLLAWRSTATCDYSACG